MHSEDEYYNQPQIQEKILREIAHLFSIDHKIIAVSPMKIFGTFFTKSLHRSNFYNFFVEDSTNILRMYLYLNTTHT